MRTKKGIVITMLVLIVFAICGSLYAQPYNTYTDLAGKTIGMESGSVWRNVITNDVKARSKSVADNPTAVKELREGIIDGVMTDLSIVKTWVNDPAFSDMKCIEIPLSIFSCPMGAMAHKDDAELMKKFNNFLAKIKEDGTLKAMQVRWLDSPVNSATKMPDVNAPKTGQKLVVGISLDSQPFVYEGNGELKGYSIELMLRFGAAENLVMDFQPSDFGQLLPNIMTKKTQMAITNISITPQRQEMALMSDSIYDDGAGILVKK